jgi:hypothetical protein
MEKFYASSFIHEKSSVATPRKIALHALFTPMLLIPDQAACTAPFFHD